MILKSARQIPWLAVAMFMAMTGWATMAAASASVEVGTFSAAAAGSDVPPDWEPLTFPKIGKHTVYTLVQDDGTLVVKAVSDAAASGLMRRISIDLRQHPIMQWRWKINNVIQKSDVARKEGDDYAARIYITFAYEPSRVGFGKKLKYQAGRVLLGDIPSAAINYIWASKTPKNTIVDNAYTDFVKMIVVQSGNDKVGAWVTEERNLFEDYQRAFGEEPPLITGVAIMTDTDNTGESATAYYGDITFKSDPEVLQE